MRGAIPPLPQNVFMAWYLVRHRFTFAVEEPKSTTRGVSSVAVTLINTGTHETFTVPMHTISRHSYKNKACPSGTNGLRPLEQRDRGFESCLKHGCTRVSALCCPNSRPCDGPIPRPRILPKLPRGFILISSRPVRLIRDTFTILTFASNCCATTYKSRHDSQPQAVVTELCSKCI
jgi:hypothetical protein